MILESKSLLTIFFFASIAMFGGISKALVRVIEENDNETLKISKIAVLLFIYTIIAIPFGVVTGGFLIDKYDNFWLAMGGALISGAISSNVIAWITGDGFVVITKFIARKSDGK